MVGNASTHASVLLKIKLGFIFVQIMVSIFLGVNMLLIFTFFSRAYFYTNTRYMLFATTLLSDCLLLMLTSMLFFINSFRVGMPFSVCLIIFILSTVYTFVTPVTLTAMTLERYVAICKPLRHAQVCSQHRALWCIFLIHGISSVPCVFFIMFFFALATEKVFQRMYVCNVDIFTSQALQSDMRLGVNQTYFIIMCLIILFCYAKIMKVAKAASGETKKSSSKGLKTVILHSFQLLLCLTQMWCPFIETAVFKVYPEAFLAVRFSAFVLFYLLPKCLSPLIYGLRDDKFVIALKYKVLCKFCLNKS